MIGTGPYPPVRQNLDSTQYYHFGEILTVINYLEYQKISTYDDTDHAGEVRGQVSRMGTLEVKVGILQNLFSQ